MSQAYSQTRGLGTMMVILVPLSMVEKLALAMGLGRHACRDARLPMA